VNSHVEKPTLAEFAALNVLSNKANLTAVSFEMAELSAVECNIFMFFSISPHPFAPGLEVKMMNFRMGFLAMMPVVTNHVFFPLSV
jgi:hypothetical protein